MKEPGETPRPGPDATLIERRTWAGRQAEQILAAVRTMPPIAVVVNKGFPRHPFTEWALANKKPSSPPPQLP